MPGRGRTARGLETRGHLRRHGGGRFRHVRLFWEYPPAGRVWLDRLLIDAARQGRGYGRAAVTSLLARLAEEYGPRDIYLSVVDGNTAAARLYETFGFLFTEERDVHGEYVMLRPAAPVRGS